MVVSGRLSLHIFKVSVLINLTSVLLFSLAVPEAWADSAGEPIRIRYQMMEEPPDRGTPPTQGGTGSRGNCLNTELPPIQITGGDRLNTTISEHPTIWVYVPYGAAEIPMGEFSLQDEEDELYRTHISLPASPGVIGIALPTTLTPLEIGKRYRWYLDLPCSGETALQRRQPASVTGVIQRMAPSPELQLQLQVATTSLQRAAAYAEQGIWYDLVTELAHLRLREPGNTTATDTWIEVLSDRPIGLEPIAREAIVGEVTASSPPE